MFYGNVLTSVTIGSGVTLGYDAITCDNLYDSNGKKAGVYRRENENSSDWTYRNDSTRTSAGVVSRASLPPGRGGALRCAPGDRGLKREGKPR